MKKITSSDKETVEAIFKSSVYTHSHFGWFDCWQIAEDNGVIWLDESNSENHLIALQFISSDTLWLHSFFSTTSAINYPIAEKFKSILSPGNYSVYSISSQNWFSSFLKNNGFRISDEIIQMETDSIPVKYNQTFKEIQPFFPEQSEIIWYECEKIFPLIWRLDKKEFLAACKTSDYRRVLIVDGKIAGYLLAEIDDSDNNCDITRIAILPDYQQKGFGRKFIDQMIMDCSQLNIKSYSVNTNKNNEPANSFYKNLNFKQVEDAYPVFYRYIRIRK